MNIDAQEVLKHYTSLKSSQKVADLIGCSEITARRLLSSHTGMSLRKLKQELQ